MPLFPKKTPSGSDVLGLLGARMLLVAPGLTTRNKKLYYCFYVRFLLLLVRHLLLLAMHLLLLQDRMFWASSTG